MSHFSSFATVGLAGLHLIRMTKQLQTPLVSHVSSFALGSKVGLHIKGMAKDSTLVSHFLALSLAAWQVAAKEHGKAIANPPSE